MNVQLVKKLTVILCTLFALYSCQDAGDFTLPDAACVIRFRAGMGVTGESEQGGWMTRATGELLAEETTVRVLAYRRPEGTSDLSAANYVSQCVYKVSSGALVPCAVNDDGTVNSGGAASGGLTLPNGEYDFYAVTPALAVNHAGDKPVMQVGHGVDFAVARTVASVVAGAGNSVALLLERRCTLLGFRTDRTDDATDITKIVMGDVVLADMPDAPMTAIGVDTLNTAANTNSHVLTLAAGRFSMSDPDNYPWKAHSEMITLPKSSAAFDMKVNVTINEGKALLLETGELPMAFRQGKLYAFTLRFNTWNGVELILGVADWDDSASSSQIGGTKFPVQVLIGEWSNTDGAVEIGGSKVLPFTPNIEVWNDLNGIVNTGGAKVPPLTPGIGDWDDHTGGEGDVNGDKLPPLTPGIGDWDDHTGGEGNVNGDKLPPLTPGIGDWDDHTGGEGDVNGDKLPPLTPGIGDWDDYNGTGDVNGDKLPPLTPGIGDWDDHNGTGDINGGKIPPSMSGIDDWTDKNNVINVGGAGTLKSRKVKNN